MRTSPALTECSSFFATLARRFFETLSLRDLVAGFALERWSAMLFAPCTPDNGRETVVVPRGKNYRSIAGSMPFGYPD
jgi:hypothetical protein